MKKVIGVISILCVTLVASVRYACSNPYFHFQGDAAITFDSGEYTLSWGSYSSLNIIEDINPSAISHDLLNGRIELSPITFGAKSFDESDPFDLGYYPLVQQPYGVTIFDNLGEEILTADLTATALDILNSRSVELVDGRLTNIQISGSSESELASILDIYDVESGMIYFSLTKASIRGSLVSLIDGLPTGGDSQINAISTSGHATFPVPEPATLPLFILGIVGLGIGIIKGKGGV